MLAKSCSFHSRDLRKDGPGGAACGACWMGRPPLGARHRTAPPQPCGAAVSQRTTGPQAPAAHLVKYATMRLGIQVQRRKVGKDHSATDMAGERRGIFSVCVADEYVCCVCMER